jgi:ArsR family transcriptional regulator
MDSAEFLDLLGNANRRRILRLLARKPCYVTEISEQLGVSPKAVIDHLKKLEEAGLIESQTDDRRRKYFSISQHVSLEVTVSPYEFGTRSAYPSNSRLDVTSCRQVSIELEPLVSRDEAADVRDDGVGTDSGPGGGTADRRDSDGTDGRAGGTADRRDSDGTDGRAGGTADRRDSDGTDGRAVDEAGVDSEQEVGNPDGATECESPAASSSAVGAPNPDAGADAGEHGKAAATTLARQLNEYEQLERELSLLHRWAEGRITDLRKRLADRVEVADPRLVSELLVVLAEEPHQMEQLCRRLGAPPPIVEELLDILASEGIVRREGRRWSLAE